MNGERLSDPKTLVCTQHHVLKLIIRAFVGETNVKQIYSHKDIVDFMISVFTQKQISAVNIATNEYFFCFCTLIIFIYIVYSDEFYLISYICTMPRIFFNYCIFIVVNKTK